MRNTTSVALKLFAIYLLIHFLTLVPHTLKSAWRWSGIADATEHTFIYTVVMACASGLLIGFALWVLWRTANSIELKDSEVAAHATGLDLDRLIVYAIACMGLYFVCIEIRLLPNYVYSFVPSKANSHTIDIYNLAVMLISALFRLSLGLFLIMKPKYLVVKFNSFTNFSEKKI